MMYLQSTLQANWIIKKRKKFWRNLSQVKFNWNFVTRWNSSDWIIVTQLISRLNARCHPIHSDFYLFWWIFGRGSTWRDANRQQAAHPPPPPGFSHFPINKRIGRRVSQQKSLTYIAQMYWKRKKQLQNKIHFESQSREREAYFNTKDAILS